MSSAATDNTLVVHRIHEAFNTCDREVIANMIDAHFHPDVTIRTPLKVDATGTDLMKLVWDVLLQGFPDLHVESEDVITEADRVVMRNTVSGTHRGEYMGVPATGKVITWNEIFIARIADGRVAETWGVVDMAGQMRQLGILPA